MEDFELQYEEHRVDTSNVPLLFTLPRPDPVYIQEWEAEDIPAVDVSSYISSIDDIRAQIKFQISEFGIPRQPLENSWEFVAAQLLRNRNPYEKIEPYDTLEQMGGEIASSLNSLTTAQDSIYQVVNSSAQFNGVNSVFADGSLTHVLEGEPASQAELIWFYCQCSAAPVLMRNRCYCRVGNSVRLINRFRLCSSSTGFL